MKKNSSLLRKLHNVLLMTNWCNKSKDTLKWNFYDCDSETLSSAVEKKYNIHLHNQAILF